ncbi:MAG TPA: hypothetical protein VG738_06500 [Chitinophagaceae bacterium]|nr:hypothetical protein [Chitinophagaceae bacterium]
MTHHNTVTLLLFAIFNFVINPFIGTALAAVATNLPLNLKIKPWLLEFFSAAIFYIVIMLIILRGEGFAIGYLVLLVPIFVYITFTRRMADNRLFLTAINKQDGTLLLHCFYPLDVKRRIEFTPGGDNHIQLDRLKNWFSYPLQLTYTTPEGKLKVIILDKELYNQIAVDLEKGLAPQ